MRLQVDEDVTKVANFMQGNMPARKLYLVALAVAKLAPLIWEEYSDSKNFCAFSLKGSGVEDGPGAHSPEQPVATGRGRKQR